MRSAPSTSTTSAPASSSGLTDSARRTTLSVRRPACLARARTYDLGRTFRRACSPPGSPGRSQRMDGTLASRRRRAREHHQHHVRARDRPTSSRSPHSADASLVHGHRAEPQVSTPAAKPLKQRAWSEVRIVSGASRLFPAHRHLPTRKGVHRRQDQRTRAGGQGNADRSRGWARGRHRAGQAIALNREELRRPDGFPNRALTAPHPRRRSQPVRPD